MNSNAIYGFNRMNAAAHAGDVNLLYTVIQDDPYVLERIDLIPFVETPLHIAASMGHLPFATEIMTLKPSFALKLNPQGFSPIHLAMQNDQKQMVYRFVKINKDLVRVRGRDGLTPLHFASQIGEVDLLAHFLLLCPESIEDWTVRCETPLHIAIKNEQFEAFQVLVGWLEKNERSGAEELESRILNEKDEAGNSILHVAALSSEPLVVQELLSLVKTKINLRKKNLENKTALDIASIPEIKSILFSAGSKPSLEVTDAPTRAHWLRSKTTILDKFYTQNLRRTDITGEERNTWLVVATLIATTMFESTLSPPGGFYQISSDDNNLNITSSNSTISTLKNVGKSVLSINDFTSFSVLNMASFFVSFLTILIMIPSRRQGLFLFPGMFFFLMSYIISMSVISPAGVDPKHTQITFFLASLMFGLVITGTGCQLI
ncbi:putative ankyrin repeat-containing domain, PGG domain-containing protein [Medicago truncatula]|uniref:Putative ankyrin repeat-containing domain, PGG domain-containing protein n=1 Tax=Medicago truncatula TaxID=3880 RepID=A0A396GKQ3_MEDTR|nr:ankyrin repeat-containing protein BDA1-like [Medicago truncatula]RHN41590.1 putative ankyrin repeat-containing domain, PGG domain-containing protein [Medicago truncatula]